MTVPLPYGSATTFAVPIDDWIANGQVDTFAMSAQDFGWLMKAATWNVGGDTDAYYVAVRAAVDDEVGALAATISGGYRNLLIMASDDSPDVGRIVNISTGGTLFKPTLVGSTYASIGSSYAMFPAVKYTAVQTVTRRYAPWPGRWYCEEGTAVMTAGTPQEMTYYGGFVDATSHDMILWEDMDKPDIATAYVDLKITEYGCAYVYTASGAWTLTIEVQKVTLTNSTTGAHTITTIDTLTTSGGAGTEVYGRLSANISSGNSVASTDTLRAKVKFEGSNPADVFAVGESYLEFSKAALE